MTRICDIAAEYAGRVGVSVQDLCGAGRNEPLPAKRGALMTELCSAGFSDGEIAKFFRRDRTAVTHARRAHEARVMARDWRSLEYAEAARAAAGEVVPV